MSTHRYSDRREAGRILAHALEEYRHQAPIVLGLPRGGVPVADEIAKALDAPLDVWVVRKVGAPLQPELGLGAVAEGGELYLDEEIVDVTGATEEQVTRTVDLKMAEVEERVQKFRRGAPPPDIRGRVAIVVDDGIATGGTARAALRALRRRGPRKLVLAVPVAAAETLEAMAGEADAIVCPQPEIWFRAVGLWYYDFSTVTDADVMNILEASRTRERNRLSRPSAERLSRPSAERASQAAMR